MSQFYTAYQYLSLYCNNKLSLKHLWRYILALHSTICRQRIRAVVGILFREKAIAVCHEKLKGLTFQNQVL